MFSLALTTYPLTQVEIASLKQGKLLLHCPEMRLVQSTEDQSRFYSGPGFISQDDELNLQFTIYAEEAVLLEDILEDFVAGKYVAGEIIPPSSYFRLTATDLTGRTWIADRLSPRRNSSFPGKTVVTGSIHEMSWEEPTQKQAFVSCLIERCAAPWRFSEERIRVRSTNIDFLQIDETAV